IFKYKRLSLHHFQCLEDICSMTFTHTVTFDTQQTDNLHKNISDLQTKTEGNTSVIRGKQRNKRNTEAIHFLCKEHTPVYKLVFIRPQNLKNFSSKKSSIAQFKKVRPLRSVQPLRSRYLINFRRYLIKTHPRNRGHSERSLNIDKIILQGVGPNNGSCALECFLAMLFKQRGRIIEKACIVQCRDPINQILYTYPITQNDVHLGQGEETISEAKALKRNLE
ncbi:Hypothetical predicted protein, partial [Mytilus galloprovincialis]